MSTLYVYKDFLGTPKLVNDDRTTPSCLSDFEKEKRKEIEEVFYDNTKRCLKHD